MSQKDDFKIIALVAVQFIMVIAGIALLRYYVFGVEWAELLWESAIMGGLLTLGLLGKALPIIDRAIHYGLAYYLLFTLIFFALLLPGALYLKAAQWVAEANWPGLKVAFFVGSGVIWLGLVAILCPSAMQARLFQRLSALGWFTPLVFLFNYIAGSTVFFGFFAYYLYGAGADGTLDSDSYLNFFGYHFLDSLPALKIPETLQLTEPMPGARPLGLGFLLLLFKLAVLIPAIGAFRVYWKSERKAGETP